MQPVRSQIEDSNRGKSEATDAKSLTYTRPRFGQIAVWLLSH